MMKRLSFVGAVLAAVVVSVQFGAAQSNPRLGTWKLNLAKSTYPAGTAPKSESRTYEAYGDGAKVTTTRTLADGTVRTITYSSHYDGKDAVYSGDPAYDAITTQRANGGAVEAHLEKGGKVLTNNLSVVSADGKTLTITVDRVGDSGPSSHRVSVFDKQ